jgi:hypothetical protein
MTRPVRLQLRRSRGFDLQAESRALNGLPAVVVARPSPFGNPFTFEAVIEEGLAADKTEARRIAVARFEDWIAGSDRWWHGPESEARRAEILRRLPELEGRNLACWCPMNGPCHADALLRLANEPKG